jgi:putative copper resistance protein D
VTGLAPIDGLALLAIAAKAAGYVAALLAMGGVLFAATFRRLADAAVLRLARRLAAGAAVVGLAVLAARFGIRAARISGMGWAGATDPTMLGFVWQSPLGTAAIWRGLGEAAILAVLLPDAGLWLAVAGAVAVAASYAQVGHTLGDPRAVLAGLLLLHLLAAAFWIGALAPLRRAARSPNGAALLHRFGVIAAGGVAILAAAGIALASLLSGSISALLGTAYGWGLLAKVAVVATLLGLAALNKWRLVPALRAGRPGAPRSLRRSIAIEGAAVLLILLLTAAITTVTTPPVNL